MLRFRTAYAARSRDSIRADIPGTPVANTTVEEKTGDCNQSLFHQRTGVCAMSNPTLLRTAMTCLLAVGAAATATTVLADQNQEQCAGVIKAGKNDCATSTNACHGHVESDANPEAWIYLPAGTCGKIAGARVVKVADPTPK
jgi:uncharacterized membrane protein